MNAFDSGTVPIAGWTPFSTCDWEGKIVACLFTQGCPLRCLYCHNPELIEVRRDSGKVQWKDIGRHLRTRKGLLDGLVISGGEPTLHQGIIAIAEEVKSYEMEVGLHTSGIFPSRIVSLCQNSLLDWVGLDIKTAPQNSRAVTNQSFWAKTEKTLDTLQQFAVDVEVRTTVHPGFWRKEDLIWTVELLQSKGIAKWVLQRARGEEWTWTSEDDATADDWEKELSEKYGMSLAWR